METRHLFFTFRMIWNHAMPRHMNVGQDIRRYAFPPVYTPAYFRQAIGQIGTELMRRNDMTFQQKTELDQMRVWFQIEQKELSCS